MPQLSDIITLVQATCTHGAPTVDEQSSPKAMAIPVADLLAVAQKLYESPDAYFDMLSCITGIDNGPEAGTMEVAYNFYSIPYNHHLMLRVTVPRSQPEVPSLAHIWGTANWHEREAYDMLGIRFTNHPDLRRILMPEDWDGHPLRKDYTHQEYYRDIKVAY